MGSKFMSAMLKSEKNVLASQVTASPRVLLQSPSLNWALSGGLRMGYTTCFYGPEQSGKSLLAMMAAGSVHQNDPNAEGVLISTEMRDPDPDRLRQLGVDPARLIIRKVNTLHDVFDWITSNDEKFVNSDGSKDGPGLRYGIEVLEAPIKFIIIDSIKAIQGPKEQNADSVEKDIMGDLSKYLNPALKGIVGMIREKKIMTIFVQQVNMNMNPDEVKYQNKKWTVPSGQALKHFCETMCLVERVESKDSKIFDDTMKNIRELPVQMGHTIRVKVDKANLDAPFREAQFRLHYNRGIVDTGLEIATLAANLGVIKHPVNPETGKEIAAQWLFEHPDYPSLNKKWVGFATAVNELENSPELQRAVMSRVYSANAPTAAELIAEADAAKKRLGGEE